MSEKKDSPKLCKACQKDIRFIHTHYGEHNPHTSKSRQKTLLCWECYSYYSQRWHAAFPKECNEELCFNKTHWTLGD